MVVPRECRHAEGPEDTGPVAESESSSSPGSWIVSRLNGDTSSVTAVVPLGYEAYARGVHGMDPRSATPMQSDGSIAATMSGSADREQHPEELTPINLHALLTILVEHRRVNNRTDVDRT
jgi:hypothetical protein